MAVPSGMKDAIVVPVFKKKDKKDCQNYRGISLISSISKVMFAIVKKRIQPARERNAREQQAGFSPGRGCADQLFCVRQVFERRLRSGQNFVVIFIDFAAAFDSVHRDSLWKLLAFDGIPPKLTRLIRSYCDGARLQGESLQSGVTSLCD